MPDLKFTPPHVQKPGTIEEILKRQGQRHKKQNKSTSVPPEHQEPLFPTRRIADAGEATHWIAAVEIALDNILDYRTEVPVLSLKPALVFSEKLLEVMKKHPIKNSEFRMTLPVDPCHGREDDSKNGPGWRHTGIQPYKRPSWIQTLFGKISTEVDVGRIV